MRPDVKPLTHWIIYKKYTVRFQQRTSTAVTGILTTPEGEVPFTYSPQQLSIELPERTVSINRYGWEVEEDKA